MHFYRNGIYIPGPIAMRKTTSAISSTEEYIASKEYTYPLSYILDKVSDLFRKRIHRVKEIYGIYLL